MITLIFYIKEPFNMNPKHSYATCLCETIKNKEQMTKLGLSKKNYNKIKSYTYYVGNSDKCKIENKLDANSCPKIPGFKTKDSSSPDKVFPRTSILIENNEKVFKMGKLAPIIHKMLVHIKNNNDKIKNKLEVIKEDLKSINIEYLVKCVKDMDPEQNCNSLYMDKDIKDNAINNNSNNNNNTI